MTSQQRETAIDLAIQAGQLSSGTIASLIGSDSYQDIERAQVAFVQYCWAHRGTFSTWQDAWAGHTAAAPIQMQLDVHGPDLLAEMEGPT